jgi:hypothetical protein
MITKPIAEYHKANFETLIHAITEEHVCLVDCQDRQTEAQTIVICAINLGKDGEYRLVPLARLFDDNPYEVLNPPAPCGGYLPPPDTTCIYNEPNNPNDLASAHSLGATNHERHV